VPVTLSLPRLLRDAKARGEKLAMVSLYDAPSAALACEASVDLILVGDSLGTTILGYESPMRVTMDDMLHHTKAVARGVQDASRSKVPIIADLPFGSYTNVRSATRNGANLVRAGAHALKLEGAGPSSVRAVRALTEMGVPVVGHLGFTPQSSLLLESVVQGKTGAAASRLLEGAQRLEDAGCCSVVLEVVPSEVARRVTAELSASTIGIGAGPHCDGQVLVWHDLVGLTKGKLFRFVKRYAEAETLLKEATEVFVGEVHSEAFPEAKHAWTMDEAELEKWMGAKDHEAAEGEEKRQGTDGS
jgi:3-methyl-2-oxobutanoate hydroxymethyltransferase